jgi:hypothetical protein
MIQQTAAKTSINEVTATELSWQFAIFLRGEKSLIFAVDDPSRNQLLLCASHNDAVPSSGARIRLRGKPKIYSFAPRPALNVVMAKAKKKKIYESGRAGNP